MSGHPIDAHVRFDTHPAHTSAVTAALTGTHHRAAQALLAARGFEPLDEHTMVVARIDHEEPYWAHQATHALHAEGITTEITPRLREAIDEEWTWANYPMHWLTRAEVREVSNAAQTIYDDIRHGRLIIHAHAHDGWTTVAIGTYLDGGTVALHGENHLRSIADRLESPAQALASFQRLHGDAVRPGPAPMTDIEQQTAQARISLRSPDTTQAPAAPRIERVPSYEADPGDHEALLNDFLTENNDWEKYRTWDDNTTIANHESLTLRVLFDHDARFRDPKWTIAAYETPVSDRMWHMTITAAAPAPVLNTLLTVLASGDAWETAIGSPAIDKTVTEATRPLTDAGWTHTMDGRWLRWQSNQEDVGVQFDAFAAQTPHTHLDTWTIWAGPSINHPTWAIRTSGYAPAGLLAHLTEELAHGSGTLQTQPHQTTRRKSQINTTPPAPPLPLPTSRQR
ncbi:MULTISPECIES: DUF317 domain-containing protein [Streptomyces]|uniref:DUF317 domain-containing protein n=1 Tax=Streptomyces TaxID=1883 RepID=UPI0029A21873|nr:MULTISPECIES: DUF317 domain-containing protein [Streptomyces]MDX2553272.1 DUF317 domain-containing protein [Streptomyces stelliscabiei]MDX2612308.1 DUF317 domain-containing protein [Streptomyces stelliscabiei]MDX2637818.1 DUF317 domain-containing protein [Streptomyces stelliscabiei]MDX2659277.1 DUF317 domain-containing protein [Streptomyces stelliscabiei]MDX2716238.1 DUF317 domain-containing protein [Streptomyces stelliscabiei]